MLLLNVLKNQVVEVALQHKNWKDAMQLEFDALVANGTWQLVPYRSNMTVVDNKWAFRVKCNVDRSLQRYKARLVAKSFQQTTRLNYFETFSPVVKACTIRIIFSLSVFFYWPIHQVDINNSFLNGDLLETIYMTQPIGFIHQK